MPQTEAASADKEPPPNLALSREDTETQTGGDPRDAHRTPPVRWLTFWTYVHLPLFPIVSALFGLAEAKSTEQAYDNVLGACLPVCIFRQQ
jgi:hypothetical protein